MSSRKSIDEVVKRKLYAESMGKCMNPRCQQDLFCGTGDIIEKAHIDPYCDTADNSFENLVILCPNCHTNFDKNHLFTADEVLSWKKTRKEELERLFRKKYATFDELKNEVVPLLAENQRIYDEYYLRGKRELWDKLEGKLLANNRMLKALFSANLNLFQRSPQNYYSNLFYVQRHIAHVDEFEATRHDAEKIRQILFPKEINSIFGITPIEDSPLPFTETLELLIEKLKLQGKFISIALGVPQPHIQIREEGKVIQVNLGDAPRLRQLYHDYDCFARTSVRLDTLNHALSYINSRKVDFYFPIENNIREIIIQDTKLTFVYEYCLSEAELMDILPDEHSVVVNLHRWNGDGCISSQAYELAKSMNVTLLTLKAFYVYINRLKNRYS